MNNGCAAAWGALGALKNRLPSEKLLIYLSDIANTDEYFPLIASSLSLTKLETENPMMLELSLLCRYSESVQSIRKFFGSKDKDLFQWLLFEFDFFNILCTAKMIFIPEESFRAETLMLQPPVCAYAAPSHIRSIDDLIAHYRRTPLYTPIKAAARKCSSVDDLYLFESLCHIEYLRMLFTIARRYSEKDRIPLYGFIRKSALKLNERSDVTASADNKSCSIIREAIQSILKELPSTSTKKKRTHTLPAIEDIFSPSWYFLFFIQNRQQCHRICSQSLRYGDKP